MKMLFTCFILGISISLLLSAGAFTREMTLVVHPNSFVNGLARYQLFALCVALLVTCTVLLISPESRQFLQIGQSGNLAEKEKWLGINGRSSWLTNGLQLLLFISLATGLFMFLLLKNMQALGNFQWRFIPLVLLFSLTNALSEELIFRFGVIGPLFNQYPKWMILALSAIAFGLPHYAGNPGGFTGILMSAVLGYILCKASIETKGLSIAWTVHFVQDIIIFMALMMINVAPNR